MVRRSVILLYARKNAKCNNKEQNDIDSQLKWHTTKVRPWSDFFLGFSTFVN